MNFDSQCQNSEQSESPERSMKRGPWSAEEDQLLMKYMKDHAHIKESWRNLPLNAGLMRSGKSCRLRWLNYLRPDVKTGSITPEEEDLIIRLHKLLGNRWSLIAGRLPERTDNEIKNYWKSHIKKHLTKTKNTPKIHCKFKEAKRMEENPKSNYNNNMHELEQPIQNVDTPFDVETNQMASSSSMCLNDNVFEEENASTISSTHYLDLGKENEIILDLTLVDTINGESVASINEEGRNDLWNPFEPHISWIDEYMEASQIYELYPEI